MVSAANQTEKDEESQDAIDYCIDKQKEGMRVEAASGTQNEEEQEEGLETGAYS